MKKPSENELQELFDNPEFREKFYELAEQFKPKKDRLKMSLDEIKEELFPEVGSDYYFLHHGYSDRYSFDFNRNDNDSIDEKFKSNLLGYKTKEECESAWQSLDNFRKLIRVRDFLRGGWKPNWGDNNDKWCISYYNNKLDISVGENLMRIFSFQNEEETKRFLELMRPQLEQYFKDFK